MVYLFICEVRTLFMSRNRITDLHMSCTYCPTPWFTRLSTFSYVQCVVCTCCMHV
uniref:Uncharacterized protein n=1 Tax=Arundo donax TaxID=35708 RepID=A0A0A9BMC0_ARUDO